MNHRLLVAAALIAGMSSSEAAVFVVTKYTDDGSAGTLRWAINQSNAINRANANATGNTIQIVPVGKPPYVIKPVGQFLPPLVGPVIVQGLNKGIGSTPSIVLDGSAIVPIRTPAACPGATATYDFANSIWVYTQVSGTGPNVRGYYGAGLAVHDSHDVEITNLQIRYFCIGVATVRSNNVYVHDMRILDHHGAAGVIFTGDNGSAGSTALSFNNRLFNSVLLDNGDGFEFTRGTTNSQLVGNYIALTQPLPVNGNAVEFATSGNNNSVIGNTFTAYSDTSMTVGSGSGHTIMGNDISGNLGNTMTSSGANNIIMNNTFNDNGGSGPSITGSGTKFIRNVSSGNGGQGVTVGNANAQNVTISQNSIFDNGRLGIDLTPTGVNLNDLAAACGDGFPDCDVGANTRQNFPVLAATSSWTAASVVLNGSLPSRPNESYTIEFFATHLADHHPAAEQGYGEGERYLGSVVATTDATGNVSFTFSLPTGDPFGDGASTGFFTATATNSLGSTSEFSLALPLTKQ